MSHNNFTLESIFVNDTDHGWRLAGLELAGGASPEDVKVMILMMVMMIMMVMDDG